jgi:signal transduction histidine kinase
LSKIVTTNQEAEKQLKNLNVIQADNITLTQQKNRLTFIEPTVDSIATIFKQSKVFLFDVNPQTKIINLIETFGYEGLQQKEHIGIYPKSIDNLSIYELEKTPVLKDFFSILQLENAIIVELNRPDLDYLGVFICGYSVSDASKVLIPENQRATLKILVQKTALINYLLKQNERLILELEERKLIEKTIAEQMIELKHSNEDLEQFAYVISHDLKAPLRNISNFSQLLIHSFSNDLNTETKEYLGFILMGVKQFEALINDLLIHSRVTNKSTVFEDTAFDLVVETVKYNLRLLIEETQTIINIENLPESVANFLQMTQVFQNLISNAIKFRQKGKSAIINISATDKKDHFLFKVSDNGIGIKAHYFERIFVLFQRLHTQTEYEGTGLGLSICKKIIQRHKGKIWVESKGLNQGTTFYFTIQKDL